MKDTWRNPVMEEKSFLGLFYKTSHPERLYATTRFFLRADKRGKTYSKPDVQPAPHASSSNTSQR